jgi:glycosyltransferase involved in cell wall biosynthesis
MPIKVSVVMSAYNGELTLARAIDGILAQTLTDLELIVVDDGSTDRTPAILAEYAARDARIRVLHQENSGLTAALIRGCNAAQAPFIARQDADDWSAPDRFEKQLAAFEDDIVVVSCWARWVGPGGEPLFVTKREGDQLRESLLHADVNTIQGIAGHGTSMFRRDAYLAAGGYRAEFRYAQDMDLWIRMARLGRIAVVPEVLLETAIASGTISARRRADQFALAGIAIALRDGGDEQTLLARARAIGAERQQTQRGASASDEAKSLYFIASCLRRNRDARWRGYAKRAVRRDPLHLRSWLLLLKP